MGALHGPSLQPRRPRRAAEGFCPQQDGGRCGQRRDGTGQCGLRLAADQSRRPVSLAKRCPTPPSQADASAVTPVGRRAGPAASPRFLSDSTKSQALR